MSNYLFAISEGLLWAIMGLGLYISFRILRFADLTSEASFTIGSATTAALMTQYHIQPLVACLIAMVVGAFVGWITGALTTFLRIPGILASIITMTGLYSINLRIMQAPNLSYRSVDTIFDKLNQIGMQPLLANFIVGFIAVIVIILFLSWLFKTDFGQAIIATGDNETMALSLGIRIRQMHRFALMISNSIIALSGALVSQQTGFSDISLGTGTVVIAMSAIVIGEVVLSGDLKLSTRLITIVLGAAIYRLILTLVLRIGLNPNDFKMISALILALFLGLPHISSLFKDRTHGLKGERV